MATACWCARPPVCDQTAPPRDPHDWGARSPLENICEPALAFPLSASHPAGVVRGGGALTEAGARSRRTRTRTNTTGRLCAGGGTV